MAEAEHAAAIAPYEGKTALRAEALLAHMGVDGRELRLAFEQQQQIGKRRFACLGLHALVQRLDEGQIIRRVHGQTRRFVRQPRVGGRMDDAHEIGMLLEITRHMLARDRIGGSFASQFLQSAARERVHAFMRTQRAGFGQHIIAILRNQRLHQMVDIGGIQQRRVR